MPLPEPRLHLVSRWPAGTIGAAPRSIEIAPPGAVLVRGLQPSDAAVVGRLLRLGFAGDGPDDLRSPAHADEEARETFAGRWGPMVWPASLLACDAEVPVAVTIVVRDDAHDLEPLLAYVATAPDARGRGLATRLIAETLTLLDGAGVDELHLAVDADNPARRLYERLGFHPA